MTRFGCLRSGLAPRVSSAHRAAGDSAVSYYLIVGYVFPARWAARRASHVARRGIPAPSLRSSRPQSAGVPRTGPWGTDPHRAGSAPNEGPPGGV